MLKPKITGFVSSSNYLSFDGSNENLTTLGGNVKITRDLNLTVGVGNYFTHTSDKNTNEPTIEAKLKYNINDNLNVQARFREIGGVEQYRVAFGGSHKINKQNSIYTAIHATAKDTGKWSFNTGAWVGYTHNFKNGISISGEFQQNIPLNKGSKNVGKTLGCFDDTNKMFNVIVSVPFK